MCFCLLFQTFLSFLQADNAEQEVSDSQFMGLVQNLLRNPEERRNFFQVNLVSGGNR